MAEELFENKTVEQMGEATLRRYALSLQQRIEMELGRLEAEQREHDKTKTKNLEQANLLEMAKRYSWSVVCVLFSKSEIAQLVTKSEGRK